MYSPIRSLWAVAAMIAMAFTACWRTIEDASVQVVKAYRAAKVVAARILEVALAPFKRDTGERMPSVRFVQAKAFVQRIIRRDRVTVTNTWRHCPSI